MKISVTVQRSEEWVKARRIETGENAPEELVVDVDTTELSPTTRKLLLEYADKYQAISYIQYNRDCKPSSWSNYGRAYIKIDSDTPTPTEIDQAILAAFAEIDGNRAAKAIEEERQRQDEELEEQKKKQRENELARARELLKEELYRLKEVEAKHELLSDFVYHIPDDACRGALKAMNQDKNEDSLEELQNRIEDASEYRVFSNEDDE